MDLTDIYLQKEGLTFKLWNIEDGIGGYPKTSPFLDHTNYNTGPFLQIKLIGNPIPEQYEHLVSNLKFVKISRIDIVDKDWELEGDGSITTNKGTDTRLHVYLQTKNPDLGLFCIEDRLRREQRKQRLENFLKS